MIVAFDIDDTLIIPSVATYHWKNVANKKVLAIYREHQRNGDYMILWSGSGTKWCEYWNEELKLNCDEIRVKQVYPDSPVDICYDDCVVNLAKENRRVMRFNNQISRKEWNKQKTFEK